MTIEELNTHVADGTIDEVIRVAEARQIKALSKIADSICARPQCRLVLLAGGSSSGKTTTASRLCTQLGVNERASLRLSTDDYFVGDKLNPRDAHGNLDYEHIDCVDVSRLAADISILLKGMPIPHRKFDFIAHEPAYADDTLTLPDGGIIVLEGIHALNPRLTESLDDALKFRLFIDPKPSLDIGGGKLLTSGDARFLRRIVRDNHYRKMSPVKTINMWPNVMAGEAKWIAPFRKYADAEFDSYLAYELSALRFYAGGLLVMAYRELGEHPLLSPLLQTLEPVTPIDADKVPGDSILRETIGGSQLEY